MNKEQIINEAYENYYEYMRDDRQWELDKEEFINFIKTDPEFSETWGLKIEERELSLEERSTIQINTNDYASFYTEEELNTNNIPTKQITLEYNNEKTYYYE